MGYGGGERGRLLKLIYIYIHLSLDTVTTTMIPVVVKMPGGDENHFNVSLIVRDKTVSTNHNIFEVKREPKRNRDEAHLSAYQPPYHQATPAHIIIIEAGCWQGPSTSDSKHWFPTSFLQPLPYLVTPQVPVNCQLTSNFLLVEHQQ